MKFYLVSSALVLFITAPSISAADKQRRLRGGSPVTDYSNYRDAIANAEDDDEGRAYGYNNYNPGREVANESGYGHMGYGHMGYGDDGDGGFPEAENFAAVGYGPHSYKNNEGYKHRATNFGSDSATWSP